jgi:hypothetical protein
MFAKLPKTVVMSEPWSLLYLHRMYNERQIDWTEYKKLLKSLVQIQYKRSVQSEIDR